MEYNQNHWRELEPRVFLFTFDGILTAFRHEHPDASGMFMQLLRDWASSKGAELKLIDERTRDEYQFTMTFDCDASAMGFYLSVLSELTW